MNEVQVGEVDACVPRLEAAEVQADLARGRVGVRVRVRVVVGLRLRVRVGVRAGARARARVTGRRGGATNATRAAWSGERRRSLYSVTWRVPSRWAKCLLTLLPPSTARPHDRRRLSSANTSSGLRFAPAPEAANASARAASACRSAADGSPTAALTAVLTVALTAACAERKRASTSRAICASPDPGSSKGAVACGTCRKPCGW